MQFSKVQIDGHNYSSFCFRLFHYLVVWEPMEALFSEMNRVVTRSRQKSDGRFGNTHVRQKLQAAGLMNGWNSSWASAAANSKHS